MHVLRQGTPDSHLPQPDSNWRLLIQTANAGVMGANLPRSQLPHLLHVFSCTVSFLYRF